MFDAGCNDFILVDLIYHVGEQGKVMAYTQQVFLIPRQGNVAYLPNFVPVNRFVLRRLSEYV